MFVSLGVGSGLGRVVGGLLLLAHQKNGYSCFFAASVASEVMDLADLFGPSHTVVSAVCCFIVVLGSSVYCGLWHSSFFFKCRVV